MTSKATHFSREKQRWNRFSPGNL